jgi:hypothetical protein
MVWGTISSLGEFAEGVKNILNYLLQFYYQMGSFISQNIK